MHRRGIAELVVDVEGDLLPCIEQDGLNRKKLPQPPCWS